MKPHSCRPQCNSSGLVAWNNPKKPIYPSHALALGIHSDMALQTIPLQSDDERVPAYLAGERLPIGENGWV